MIGRSFCQADSWWRWIQKKHRSCEGSSGNGVGSSCKRNWIWFLWWCFIDLFGLIIWEVGSSQKQCTIFFYSHVYKMSIEEELLLLYIMQLDCQLILGKASYLIHGFIQAVGLTAEVMSDEKCLQIDKEWQGIREATRSLQTRKCMTFWLWSDGIID